MISQIAHPDLLWSLNEVDSICRKAARGIGLPWGMAEEAGRAARWLTEQGLPGAQSMAALLAMIDGRNYVSLVPQIDQSILPPSGGELCPVVTGVVLTDRDMTGAPWATGPMMWPVLLLPFVAATGRPVIMSWNNVTVSVEGRILKTASRLSDLLVAHCDGVTLRPGLIEAKLWDVTQQYPISRATAAALHGLAERTFAPATDASRNAGAGGADV